MKFSKNIFCKLFVACVGLIFYSGAAIGVLNCTQNPDPGKYCYEAGNKPPCPSGCWCQGGIKTAVKSDDNTWLSHPSNRCANRDSGASTYLSARGINYCPDPFTSSDEGASAATQCYDPNCGVHNKQVTCPQGTYLPSGEEDNRWCTSCPAGHECPGGTFLPSCTQDQGKTECSGDLYYATMGQSACSPCDGAGQRIFTSGVLNIDCQTCPDGKYALADHSDCADCPVGYSCQSGIRHKCTGKTYSDVEGLAECKVCSGDKKGVTYTTTTVNGQTETLQTGCGICPNGKYGNDGVCEPCPAGYRCLNGEKIICAKGYYSAAGAVSCTHCPNYFTTEGPGTAWTQGENVPCTVVQIYLKDANTSGNGIMFPACLNRGDINERLLYSN